LKTFFLLIRRYSPNRPFAALFWSL